MMSKLHRQNIDNYHLTQQFVINKGSMRALKSMKCLNVILLDI